MNEAHDKSEVFVGKSRAPSKEEAAMIMPCDGRIVSVTVRMASITGDGNMTIGIETIAPNINQFGSANWTSEETESLAVTGSDDYHVFHFAFDNAKHFDSGDLVSLSIQNDADLSGTTYFYVSTVVEYDWNTFLGTTLPLKLKKVDNSKLNGPTVDGNDSSPKRLNMFETNKTSISCCEDSPYLSSNGCVCLTSDQEDYLVNRGGNHD